MARKLAREEGILVGMSFRCCHACRYRESQGNGKWNHCCDFTRWGESVSQYRPLTIRNIPLSACIICLREKGILRTDPIPKKLLMHSCGPTVHEVPTCGKLSPFLFVSDMIRRYLEFKEYKVRHEMELSYDYNDRSIKESERADMELPLYTEKCTTEFISDIEVEY